MKTTLMQEISAFLTLFGNKYADLKNENGWTTIVASYKDIAVKKFFAPIRKKIKKGVSIFNDIYPNTPLSFNGSGMVDKDNHIELFMKSYDGDIKYSECWALSTQTSQDGFSAAVLILDEGTLTEAFGENGFFKSLKPFTNSMSSVTACVGITSTQPTCVQYVVHFNENSKHCIYDWKQIYDIRRIEDPTGAEKYKNSVQSDINLLGEHSTEVAVNYLMTYDIIDGKFITRDVMLKNKMMQSILRQYDTQAKYKCAGLDLASVNDRTVLTIGEVYEEQRSFQTVDKFVVRDIIVFNMNRNRISSEDVAKDVAKYCLTNEIDMLLIDGTGTQGTFIEWIYKELKSKDVNTLICPYNFSGVKNKVILMSNLENALFSNTCILPKDVLRERDEEWALLYDELIYLIKDKSKGVNSNTQYYAPSNKTDDAVMSLALANYCYQYIKQLEMDKKYIEFGLYKYRARLNKFKSNTIKTTQKQQKYYLIV